MYSVQNECFVVLLSWSESSAQTSVGRLGHVPEQIKDLFHTHFFPLLRIPEAGTVEYKSFRILLLYEYINID
jgi:hypothetical protein